MAKRKGLALALTVALLLGLCGCEDTFVISQKAVAYQPLTRYESLGIPSERYYPNSPMARIALDMALYDGRLYVGCGDYNENTGPTPVLSCDLDTLGQWEEEASLRDEQVGRFVSVGGRLTIPGFDPMGRPESGTYYQRNGKTWQTRIGLPHNLHNFDMMRYKGAIFAALAAPEGKSPIAVSRNGGKTYKLVRMVRDGKQLTFGDSDFSRCYNLYELNGILYADLRYIDRTTQRVVYDVYRYQKGVFVYVGDLNKQMQGGLYGVTTPPLWEQAELGDTLYLTTGYLYATQDMQTFQPVVLAENAVAYDLYRYGRRLYILTATPKQEEETTTYTVEIYSVANPQKEIYRKEARFEYPVIPTALAVDKDHFFIAMGNWYAENRQNGTVLCMHRK